MAPPDKIDGALVVEWAWSDEPFGELSDGEGNTGVAIHGLALCRYDRSAEIYRFSCDPSWEVQQDAKYASIAEAKAKLPEQYRRVEPQWNRVPA